AADPDRPRVLLDVMCGALARYLRFCGYDAAYALEEGIEDDDRLAALAAEEGRTLLTRDRDLAARVDDSLLLTERDVLDQLREVADAGYPVSIATEPTRCGACNGPLERVDGAVDPPSYVPDDPRPRWRCRDCDRWFWKGSHWASVAERVAGIGADG
ncbi:Mut7-C RNAse domain-containing protein, partial [Halorubrum halodurans]